MCLPFNTHTLLILQHNLLVLVSILEQIFCDGKNVTLCFSEKDGFTILPQAGKGFLGEVVRESIIPRLVKEIMVQRLGVGPKNAGEVDFVAKRFFVVWHKNQKKSHLRVGLFATTRSLCAKAKNTLSQR